VNRNSEIQLNILYCITSVPSKSYALPHVMHYRRQFCMVGGELVPVSGYAIAPIMRYELMHYSMFDCILFAHQ
jgi:hypothetical protein